MRWMKFSPILILALYVFFSLNGCRGKTGPAGPQGPPGTVDTVATYLGNDTANCAHCHDNLVLSWMTTGHSISYDTASHYPGYSENCNQCHSTGWNTAINNGGYDENHSPSLRDVQCEACHGPMGPNPAVHAPQYQTALNGDVCNNCHGTTHAEWAASLHGSIMDTLGGVAPFIAEWGSSSCNYCHTAEGYLYKWDPTYANMPPNFSTGIANMITCGVCHDPHAKHDTLNLRAMVPIQFVYPAGYTVSNWGMGLMCGNCHRDRRDSTQIVSMLNNGSTHFGPHESPQSNMLRGYGAWSIPGQTYTHPNTHDGVQQACVHCHVPIGTQQPHPDSTGHTFLPKTFTCTCHNVTPDFDYVGPLGGKQAVADLMDTLETIIVQGNPNLGGSIDSVGVPGKGTVKDRTAAWAFFFVERDGSEGVHNIAYAKEILQNSINYYRTTPGDGTPRGTIARR